jgi:hypothetical protein
LVCAKKQSKNKKKKKKKKNKKKKKTTMHLHTVAAEAMFKMCAGVQLLPNKVKHTRAG